MKDMVNNVKISIITVCLNAENTITKTIQSVLLQNYGDWEYIIMDGQSIDKTMDVIHEALEVHGNSKRVQVFSEKDKGLYQAMNKAMDICSGEYVLFLNSGDEFASNTVITEVVNAIADINRNRACNRVELAYGNVIRLYRDGNKLEKYLGKHRVFRMLMMGKMPCHQVIFTRIDVMRKYRFDESYQICADFDFLVRCKKGNVKMFYFDIDVSKVDCVEGISSQRMNLERMRKEDDRSIRDHYMIMYYLIWVVKWAVRRVGDRVRR